MAYIKNTWVDREGTTRYFETTDNDGAKIFTPDYSEVTEIGTPVNADNMNHIEEGIAGCDLRKYDLTETYEKGEWVTGIVDDVKGIYESLANNNYGNPLTDETKWKKVELGGSGTGGHNLFDLITTDYILEGDEAVGKAFLGTYVYKTGVSGTREGYPDFYNKCVAEFDNSVPDTIALKNHIGMFGILNRKNGVLSGFTASIYAYPNTSQTFAQAVSSASSWEAVFSFKLNTLGQAQYILGGNNGTYTPDILINANNTFGISLSSNGSSYNIAQTSGKFVLSANTDYLVKLEFTGTKYILSYSTDGEKFTPDITVTSSTKIESTTDYSYIGCRGNLGGPLQGSIDLKGSYINVNGQRWWTGADVFNFYMNANGHAFYDIADKAIADEIYENTGVAWYYGVDKENERIFLPRGTKRNRHLIKREVSGNKSCDIYSDGWAIQSESNINTKQHGTATYTFLKPFSNTSYDVVISKGGWADGNERSDQGITAKTTNSFNYSSTGSTVALGSYIAMGYLAEYETIRKAYGTKYQYMVVGNIEQESAITDVIDVTTTENDTIPLFTPMYFDFKPNNVSWLKAGEQVNSGGIYTFVYNELVNELTNPKYALKVIEAKNKVDGVNYSEYWTVDQDAMTFTTPTEISFYPLINSDTIPVVGNGKSIKLTTSTGLNGTFVVDGINIQGSAYSANYLKMAGVSTGFGTNQPILLTNDPDSSGLVAQLDKLKSSETQLYFKVANAVQNLELMDAGAITEALADKINMEQAASASSPSNRYLNLTLGASQTNYTAPADGWFAMRDICNAGGFINLYNQTTGFASTSYSSIANGVMVNSIPVKKGDVVQVVYSIGTSDAKAYLRFYYAEGAQ